MTEIRSFMLLFVDNLTNIDFSYLHPSRGLVGETWLANIELEGQLDNQGMVCDFGIVKKLIRDWLDTEIDHRLLVPRMSESAQNIRETDETKEIIWKLTDGQTITCHSPESAITFTDTTDTDPENIAQWCIAQLKPLFPDSVKAIRLSFITESIDGPYYHYSHGLKKHRGNCQRIAHGHRSKIEIWKDGSLDESLMSEWSDLWADGYLGTREDMVEQNDQTTEFAYHAEQGEFKLSLPTSRCYLMETDTTVELIANHILKSLQKMTPESTFIVRAYEGIGKGAVAR